MFVGTTGVDRVVRRTAELMREHDTADIGPHGGIPLDIIQKYINFHFTVSLDLFGGETSTNVATYYTTGLKGRWQENRRDDDHVLTDSVRRLDLVSGGRVVATETPALIGLNEDLRDEYIADCETGIKRWNRILDEFGVTTRLYLPHKAFNRKVGTFASLHVTPDGQLCDAGEWERRSGQWLPSAEDKAFVAALMHPVYQPGRIAAWVAPPSNGINNRPLDYQYVRFT